MRKFIALTFFALAIPASGNAQEIMGAQMRGPQISTIEWLIKSKDEFNATTEQVTKLEELSTRFKSETAKLREELQKVRAEMMNTDDRQATMQKMRPLREELQKKDEAAVEEAIELLNDEQKQTVNTLLETRRNNNENRRRRSGAGIRP